MAENVDAVMQTIPEPWRTRWCGGEDGPCACLVTGIYDEPALVPIRDERRGRDGFDVELGWTLEVTLEDMPNAR